MNDKRTTINWNKFTDEMVQEVHDLVETQRMGYVTAAQVVAQYHGLTTHLATSNWMTDV